MICADTGPEPPVSIACSSKGDRSSCESCAISKLNWDLKSPILFKFAPLFPPVRSKIPASCISACYCVLKNDQEPWLLCHVNPLRGRESKHACLFNSPLKKEERCPGIRYSPRGTRCISNNILYKFIMFLFEDKRHILRFLPTIICMLHRRNLREKC